jgi:hypothetical protein
MTKTQTVEISTKELAVLINRSVRTARRYMVKLPNARKVSGKWTVVLSAEEVRKVRSNAIELARFVAKELRDQQCGTASEDLQDSADRSFEMLRVVGARWLVYAATKMIQEHNPNLATLAIERLVAA